MIKALDYFMSSYLGEMFDNNSIPDNFNYTSGLCL